jgi:hypothetical protein
LSETREGESPLHRQAMRGRREVRGQTGKDLIREIQNFTGGAALKGTAKSVNRAVARAFSVGDGFHSRTKTESRNTSIHLDSSTPSKGGAGTAPQGQGPPGRGPGKPGRGTHRMRFAAPDSRDRRTGAPAPSTRPARRCSSPAASGGSERADGERPSNFTSTSGTTTHFPHHYVTTTRPSLLATAGVSRETPAVTNPTGQPVSPAVTTGGTKR